MTPEAANLIILDKQEDLDADFDEVDPTNNSGFYPNLDEEKIKRRGFIIATHNNNEQIFKEEADAIDQQYADLLLEYKKAQDEKLNNVLNASERQDELIKELLSKKASYLANINADLPAKRDNVDAEITQIRMSILQLAKSIGHQSESVVKNSLARLKTDLDQLTDIQLALQDKHNQLIEQNYLKNSSAIKKRIDFLQDLLAKHSLHYDQLADRLRLLLKDGITGHTTTFLIILGYVSALVSGWWFGIWSNPQQNNITGNNSVQFYLINNFSAFLSRYGTLELTGIVIAYILGVGIFSWLCNLGINNIQGGRNNHFYKNLREEQPQDIEIRLKQLLDPIKFRLNGSNWWIIWLKVAPLIFILLPILVIFSKPLQNSAFPSTTGLQSLYDSLYNEFIGTCIAIGSSVFGILYFNKVTENSYHRQESSGKGSHTFLIGFILFLLLIASMTSYSLDIFPNVKLITILGFMVGCTATAFGLGYGYYYYSLKYNSEFMLERINTISSLIGILSKPYQINYVTNKSVVGRVNQLQQQLFDMLEEKYRVAISIAALEDKPNTYHSNHIQPKHQNWIYIFRRFFGKWAVFRNTITTQNASPDITLSQKHFFAESAEELKQHYDRLADLKLQKDRLEQEEMAYLRNEGTWRSISDQIKNAERRKLVITNYYLKCKEMKLAGIERLKDAHYQTILFLKEGYQTGLWFKTIK